MSRVKKRACTGDADCGMGSAETSVNRLVPPLARSVTSRSRNRLPALDSIDDLVRCDRVKVVLGPVAVQAFVLVESQHFEKGLVDALERSMDRLDVDPDRSASEEVRQRMAVVER